MRLEKHLTESLQGLSMFSVLQTLEPVRAIRIPGYVIFDASPTIRLTGTRSETGRVSLRTLRGFLSKYTCNNLGSFRPQSIHISAQRPI